jgi:lauroyl/myristoyl acyltransferase
MSFVAAIKKIRYLLEALIVRFGLMFFSFLSLKNASDFAAKIAKFIGKKIAVNRLAYNNLTKAMPFLSENKKEEIIDDMWDNLGRIVGEFAHVGKLSMLQIKDFVYLSPQTQKIIQELKSSDRGGIFFLLTWETGKLAPKF